MTSHLFLTDTHKENGQPQPVLLNFLTKNFLIHETHFPKP